MSKLFAFLSSLKLAVILLVLLLLGLSAGTIVESRLGTETAGRLVYYSVWFLGLQALLAVNVALSLASLFPWAKRRIGFVVTHASLLLILAGATVTYFAKVEGNLLIPEGGSATVIEQQNEAGQVLARHPLPFSVHLDQFVVETYPGTTQPSGFESRVRITDPATGQTIPARIWMNHEFHYRGYALFQSSYQQGEAGTATVLSVSKDPGQIIVFAGYLTLILGMVIVLATRVTQAREAGRAALVMLVLLVGAASVRGATLGQLPVQHDGRTMPLDTLARETVWAVTGAYAWQGQDPVDTFLGWTLDPNAGSIASVIRLGSSDLAREIGLPGLSHASFMQLLQNGRAMQLLQEARTAETEGRPRQGLLQVAEKLGKRLELMQTVLQQQVVLPLPVPGDPMARWTAPLPLTGQGLANLLTGPRLQGWPTEAKIDQEILYNRLNPVRLSWVILLASLGVSLLAWRNQDPFLDWVALGLLLGGFAMMSWGILLRWHAGERFPAANMYESLLFLAWGVGLFALAAYVFLKNRLVVVNAAAMATLTLLLTDLLPIDRFIHPVAPVLSGTPWLAIHVPIIMLSYAILALGMVVAHMQVAATAFRRQELADRLYEILYWYVFAGSIFLITGIITGSMWAASSWGRYWGWDPKEVWSLVAFLAYMAILHAKLDRLIGKFGVAVVSIAAFQTILMTYLGVNFVLTIGMHSYAMGDSPVALWMVLVGLVEIIFLGWGILAQRKHRTL
jgi:ABC-type transport system involved in cytochrome c biogenesis permease subunit